jgi:hypothetical protein
MGRKSSVFTFQMGLKAWMSVFKQKALYKAYLLLI